MFLYMLRMKEFTDEKSWGSQYIEKVRKFPWETVVKPLIDKGYVIDLNSPGKAFPEYYVIDGDGDKIFATYQMGEEFWENYPKTFPISGSGNFIARAGIEKDDLIELYLKNIENSPEIHLDVMQRVKTYERKVKSGELNGHKIGNFVKERLWEIIESTSDNEKFGRTV